MRRLHFCTAGVPHSSPKQDSLTGLRHVASLGLDGMEMEFVHGVRMPRETAQEMRAIAASNNLVLTAHAPYYINLNAAENQKWHASITRIVQTAQRATDAGAYSICFHPGFYQGQQPEKVFSRVREALAEVFRQLGDTEVWVRPETTGKGSQFGSLQECIALSKEFERMLPCVDFSHLHARSGGKFNTTEEFRAVLAEMERELGRTSLENMHIHLSGIAYSEKGERNHLILEESDMRWRELLAALKEFRCAGALVCESPNIETDTGMLKRCWQENISPLK